MEDPVRLAPARLTIAARSGSIVVRAVRGGSVEGGSVEAHGAKVRTEPDGATRIEGGSKNIEVTCPAGSDVILGTSSGKVSLEGVFGDVRVTSSSGSVHVEEARSIDLRLRSGSVEIESCDGDCHVVAASGRVEIARAGRVDVKGISGTIELGSVAGGVVRTTSGRVSVGLARAADLEVRGVSGSVDIEVPRSVAPELQLRTRSGRVKSDVEPGHDCVIAVHVVSGSIQVQWT